MENTIKFPTCKSCGGSDAYVACEKTGLPFYHIYESSCIDTLKLRAEKAEARLANALEEIEELERELARAEREASEFSDEIDRLYNDAE